MKITQPHALRRFAFVSAALGSLIVAGCAGGYVEVGGYDGAYVTPPAAVETYPRYQYGGEYVYDVDGQYYRRHDGRWMQYRNVPPDVTRWHDQRYDHGRGRAEPQRR